jgi:hypothetical protein
MMAVARHAMILVCLLGVTGSLLADPLDECHSGFSAYAGARPYIVNANIAERRTTQIVAVFEDISADLRGAVPYRIEIRSAATGELVALRRGVTLLIPGEQAEAKAQWDGRDPNGALVPDGEYVIVAVAQFRAGAVLDRKLENAELNERDGVVARSSEVRVVVDHAGVYDGLFTPESRMRLRTLAASIDPAFPYQFFFGTTHAHTNWSDGGMPTSSCTSGHYGFAGGAQPVDAFNYAKTNGSVDFLAVVEHNHLMQDACTTCTADQIKSRYASGFTAAQTATVAGSFVGLWGMEWGVISGGGHVNVYNQAQLMSWTGEPYNVLTDKSNYPMLYTAMKNNQGALGSYGTFNHPETTDFGSYVRSADGDAVIRGMSMVSGPAFSTSTSFTPGGTVYTARFNQALSYGWKIAPEAHQDNHCWNYGNSTPNRTVALVPNGTTFDQPSLVSAYGARHFYAQQDRDAQLIYRTADGAQIMGNSFSAGAGVPVYVKVSDPAGEAVQKIEVWGGRAGTVASPGAAPTVIASNTATPTLNATINLGTAGETWYYYVVAVQADGDQLWSAPMWITWSSGCTLPAAPSLSSPASGATGVATSPTLSWSAVSGATSYDVYLSTASSPAFLRNVTTTSTSVGPLTAGTLYYWTVVAKTSCGAGPAAATRSFTTAATTGVTTLTNGQTVASLSGAAGSWAHYKIAVPSGQSSLDIVMSGGTGDADLYVKLGAQPTSTVYDYRPYLSGNNETVTVTNPAAGDWYISINGYQAYSGVSLTATYTGSTCTAPGIPALSAPAAGATGVSTSPSLSWGAVSGATSYDLYLSTSSSPAFLKNVTTTSTTAGPLSGGTLYYWNVVARNSCGSSAPSVTRSFTTQSGPVTILSEGAESGAAGWTLTKNTGSGWSIEASTDVHSGASRFKTNVGYTTYINSADWAVVSPAFSLAGKTSATLTFYDKYKTESGYDFWRVEISTNGGTSWTQLRSVSGQSSGYPSWAPQVSLSLNAYAGQTNVKLRFRFTSDGSVADWGVALDDILVTAQ